MTKKMFDFCTVERCNKKHDAKGFCSAHYHSFMRYGDPLVARHGVRGTGWFDKKGYKYLPEDKKSKRVNRMVAEKVLGHPLPKGSVVHHVDENIHNNANNNLVICQSYGYHRQIHMRMDALMATGNAKWRKCPICHEYDDPQNMSCWGVVAVHRICMNERRKLYYHRRKERKSNDIHA